MTSEEKVAAVMRFARGRVAVIGDLMLDVYLWGSVTRISPEAPVPVVNVKKRTCCLGGAGRCVLAAGGLLWAEELSISIRSGYDAEIRKIIIASAIKGTRTLEKAFAIPNTIVPIIVPQVNVRIRMTLAIGCLSCLIRDL